MRYSRGVYFLIFFALGIVALPSTLAVSVSVTDVSDTLATVSISNADNLYAYEVKLSYSGSITGVTSANFLGSSSVATYGYSMRNGVLSVYGSRLDNSQTGVSGSGQLFNVTHSGTLSLSELLAVDDTGDEETVSYSSSDDSGGSSSSGGGSSSSGSHTSAGVTVNPSSITLTVAPHHIALYNLTLTNPSSGAVEVQFSQEGFNGTLTLPSSISVPAQGSLNQLLIFEPLERGLVTGTIHVFVGSLSVADIPVIVNVKPENFLFDVAVTLANRYRVIEPGTALQAQVNLAQVGRPEDRLDVVANYYVKDFIGKSYLEDHETFFVDGQKEYVKEFATQGLPPGKYVLGLELVYANAFATSSVQFEVREGERAREFLVTGIWGVMIVLVVGTGIWFFLRKRKLSYMPSHLKGKI